LDPYNSAARAQKLHQQSHVCDWPAIDADKSYFAELGVKGKAIPPLPMLSIEDAPDRHRLRSELYARERILQKPLPATVKPSKTPKRLRIGYFSTDFTEHPVAYLIVKVLEQHNRDSFEVFGYCLHNNNKKSELRSRLINSFDYFFETKGISDKEVALQAREDKIDIAIDLNGYTQNARPGIFAYRAAPIQINYLGYPGTLGAEFMDYIVADKYLIPPDTEKYFNEKKLYLPNTYMPTDDGREISTKEISRSEMGLPEDAFVFCCFNNNYKITSSEFDIWMRLLKKVDKSVLWLRQSNQFSHVNIKNEAKKRNIDPSRIVFAKRAPMDEHLARQKLADLFIDTFAFNAHTTTTEALWAGLPVITKTGKGFAARVAGSLLNAIGLPELITKTEQDYEALALELATHPNHLKQIKAKLDTNRLSKPLFNTKQYTNHLETAYKMAYDNYFNEQDGDNIFVPI
jgi:predicted O-linked N-acetylglucosamine transferase (SPINDLY family)